METITQPVLDWHPRNTPDPRNTRYTLTRQAGVDTTRPVRSRQWTASPPLDQGAYNCPVCGQHGACTGYSAMRAMGAQPRHRSVCDAAAHGYYHRAKQLDEWAGENYEGSSVHGAVEALRQDGLLTAYWWLTNLEDLTHAVSRYGPVMVGTPWRTNMFTPNAANYVTATGPTAGGHAYTIAGINTVDRWLRIDNSWGTGWGRNGSAKITYKDMESLLAEHGAEAVLPRKTRP